MKRWLVFYFLIQVFSTKSQHFTDISESINIAPFNVEIQYGSGANLVDVDNNGFIDLFLLGGIDSPCNLYLNYGNTWSEPIPIGNEQINSRAAVWFDFNNDNKLDVFIASDCSNTSACYDSETFALFLNNGDETFTDVSITSGIATGKQILSAIKSANYTGGVSAGDLNLDGYLDLIVTRWGGELFLFMNNGDGTFNSHNQILNRTGLHFYWQPLIFDMDSDHWPEIFVTLDADEENIYMDRLHQTGTYRNLAKEMNLHHKFHDMGVVIGDYDNDNDFDLYITNIERFEKSRNVLYNKASESVYEDLAIAAHVDRAGWAWGVTFNDFNNDGFLDLGVTNGWEAHDQYRHDQSRFWLGTQHHIFLDVSEPVNFNDTLNGSFLSGADIDRDGDMDMVQGLKSNERSVHLRLMQNNLQDNCKDCNYLTVKPRMMGGNHLAIGSSVSIKIGEESQMRAITAGIGYYGQEPAEAFFGVGAETIIDQLTVKWPSGDSTIIHNVEVNQVLNIYDSASIHNIGFVAITLKDSATLDLVWGHMSTSETGYTIQRSTQSDFTNAKTYEINSEQKTFTDNEVEPFKDYYYRIKAVGSSTESKWSETYFASTRREAFAPIGLEGTLTNNSIVELSWQDTTSLDLNYELQRSLDSTFTTFISYHIANAEVSFLDKNVEPGFRYHYRIRQNSEYFICPFSNTETLDIPETTSIILGSNTLSDSLHIIYPNPSSGKIQFEPDTSIKFILLHSLSGRLIKSYPIKRGQDEISIKQSGVYILSFHSDKELLFQHTIRIQ